MALVALACAFVFPSAARAELLVVDSTADEADAVPGVDGCLTLGGKCTLRAAIEESNSSVGESDEIVFDETIFDGQVGATIALASSLPTMVDPGRINGRECATAAGVNGPCVGVHGPAAGAAVAIGDADGVEIEGLAVTGSQTGLSIEGSLSFRVRSSWFGIKLDGSADGNATGIFVGPESDFGRIGGEGPEAGNVVVNSSGDGLHVHGVGNVRVLGNYFGVERDGVTQAANEEDIEVTSIAPEGPQAVGTVIGTRVNAGAAATPACDGGCNLISGALSNGIDLEGDGGAEASAATTTIVGNYIGLNGPGTASIPNASVGIRVGKAAQTVIGGPKAGEANRINGGSVGVDAGGAPDLVVRGNLIGVDAAGTGSLAPPGDGVVVDSAELASPAVEAVIADNAIRMEGGVAIAQQGLGARISSNEIFGAEVGIRVHGSTGEHGNLIEGNSVEGSEVNGIRAESSLNEILGNEVSGTGGAGIRIQGSAPFGVTENQIGGDSAAEENVIAGSGGDAIEIFNVEETVNEVARNRGIVNGGSFIDLVPVSPGTEGGPNYGIGPPQFTVLTLDSASGSGAKAGANVRVFRKRLAAAGEVESFLGEATADAEGNWMVAYGSAIPAGAIVAATQTSEAGGTSELAIATTPGDGGDGGGGAVVDGGASATIDRASPETKIAKAPKKIRSRTAWFKFDSDEPGSAFQCSLDGKPFRACRSPKKYDDLSRGGHVFKVRAVDLVGNLDLSPARKRFTVLVGDGG